MLKKDFLLPGVALALLMLLALPASAAQKNVDLADFNGTWRMDAEKSRGSTKEAANKVPELSGFKMAVNAKARTIRMEWPDHRPEVRKITGFKADGQRLSCNLEGYNAAMLLEKVSDEEIQVKDRDEALVFVKVKE